MERNVLDSIIQCYRIMPHLYGLIYHIKMIRVQNGKTKQLRSTMLNLDEFDVILLNKQEVSLDTSCKL